MLVVLNLHERDCIIKHCRLTTVFLKTFPMWIGFRLTGTVKTQLLFSDIDKLHLKFCKRILGVHPKSTNLAVLAELGRLPMAMSVQISTLVIKYWLRINSPNYKKQLVGKAVQVCIQSGCEIL